MRFQLTDEDRERLGAPEWIDYDPLHLNTRDAELLEAAGAPYRAWGTTQVVALRLPVWLALHNAGAQVPFDEVHFDLAIRVADESPGKARSKRSASPTPSPSAT